MYTPPVIYGQRDYPDKLGDSTVTIAGYGCAITSACDMLESIGIHVTPPQLNDWLKKNKGYVQKNLLDWYAIERFSGGKLKFAGIKSTPDVIPCIAEVDLVPTTSQHDQHFVQYLGEGMCNDPWTKKIRPIKDFNGAIGYRVYNINVPLIMPNTGNTGGSMQDTLFKDAFLDIMKTQFNDNYDEKWNDDQKKEWIKQKKQRIIDAIKAGQTPQNPVVDPLLQEKYNKLNTDHNNLLQKVSNFKVAHASLLE